MGKLVLHAIVGQRIGIVDAPAIFSTFKDSFSFDLLVDHDDGDQDPGKAAHG